MRILVISPTPTHPTLAGNCIRILNLLETLQQLSHEVHFLHVSYSPGDTEAMQRHWGKCFHAYNYKKPWRKYRFHGIPIPDRVSRKIVQHGWLTQTIDQFYDEQLNQLLRDLHGAFQFDVVMVEYVFFSAALDVFPNSVHKLIDTHDIYTDRHTMLKRNGMQVDWFFTNQAEEQKGLQRADMVIAIQDHEQAMLTQILQGSRPVVTVGHFLQPNPQATPHRLQTMLLVGSNNAINTQYFQQFINECWCNLHAQYPTLRLKIVGGVCSQLKPAPGIELLGFVDDLSQAYAAADLVINPLLSGTGLKIKSLEALSFGRALVTTPAGIEGLEPASGQAAVIVENFTAMRDAIEELINDVPRLIEMSHAANELTEQYINKQLASLELAITPPNHAA
ncbi:glycosyltransferase [Cerasicoccus frondis]|uniref:glycosyltransferase n=1 Tax=Cerasicoccus frondis TaxID=490090 RepID=UPI00285269EA|nr:glycosyltransferase family 4 protein [Cerasicoccus frondis]